MTAQANTAMEIAYLALGRLIAAECPSGFATAWLRVESVEDRTGLLIDTEQPDGTRVQLQPGAAASHDILESLRGIRNAMVREGGAAWRNCTVTLRAGGHFAIEFED